MTTDTLKMAAARVGGPGVPDAKLCAEVAIAILIEAAGDGLRLTSLALDVASHAVGDGEVAIALKVDKRTRSIVFVSAEARAGEQLVFSAQGLFSRA